MKPIALRAAEPILIVWIFLTIILIVSDLMNLSEASFQDDPLNAYRSNPGVIKISIASLLSRLLFVGCLSLLRFKPQHIGRVLLSIFILSGLTAAFMQWYELYYGSTFYYGEVRDKQGLMFPLLASSIVTLIIWECSYSSNERRDLLLKAILTVLVNLGLYVLWLNVYEAWNLFQS